MTKHEDPNLKGNIAEAEIVAAATALGIPVLRPLVEHTRYDMVFDLGSRLLRVQCKWASVGDGVIKVRLSTSRMNFGGQVRSTYSVGEIDAVAVYAAELDACFLLPVDLIDGRNSIWLRVEKTSNGQRAALNWAADYEFAGAVAQLGERLSGTQEGTGSSPVSSTAASAGPPPNAVGAHEFRNRFGYYMELAAAGHEVDVSRRGRPSVRLVPARPPLEAGASEGADRATGEHSAGAP